jgi:chromate transporter
VDWFALAVALAALVALVRYKVGLIPVIALAGAAGMLWKLA